MPDLGLLRDNFGCTLGHLLQEICAEHSLELFLKHYPVHPFVQKGWYRHSMLSTRLIDDCTEHHHRGVYSLNIPSNLEAITRHDYGDDTDKIMRIIAEEREAGRIRVAGKETGLSPPCMLLISNETRSGYAVEGEFVTGQEHFFIPPPGARGTSRWIVWLGKTICIDGAVRIAYDIRRDIDVLGVLKVWPR